MTTDGQIQPSSLHLQGGEGDEEMETPELNTVVMIDAETQSSPTTPVEVIGESLQRHLHGVYAGHENDAMKMVGSATTLLTLQILCATMYEIKWVVLLISCLGIGTSLYLLGKSYVVYHSAKHVQTSRLIGLPVEEAFRVNI